MSNSPETGLDLEDLELQLLPAWAKQSPDANRYAKYEGGEGDSGPRGRERRERRGPPSDRSERPRRREGGPRTSRDESPGPRRGGGGRHERPRRDENREPAPVLPEVSVSFVPEEKGVESLARQIKLTGRAYPIFDIGHLILKRPDRYHVVFVTVKKADGQVAQPLWVCNLDDTLWLSDQEAAQHVLRRHFETFYKAERIPADPPKGTYTFVAQCGLSGAILGPPNYHDYQNKLRKLHAERFSRMPFELFKAKVRIIKDEAVVKKWIEEQSWKTEYHCLNVPEPKRLGSREEVERHFREAHFGNIVRAVESHTLAGVAAQQLPTPALRQLVRRGWDEQQRFPLKIVTTLSQQFAAHGLQFFKVNRTITHVAVARPHFLDLETTPVSEGVKGIVVFINAHSGCTRRQLFEALAPSAARAVPAATPLPAENSASSGPTAGAAADIPARPSALPPSSSGDLREPTAEQTAVIADLHWLIHQGHVIEFANGRIEAAKKPVPKPPRPEPKLAESSVSRPTSSNETTASIQLTATPAPPSQEEEDFPASRPDEAAPALTAPEGAADRPESPAETAGASPAPLNPADSATAPDQGV